MLPSSLFFILHAFMSLKILLNSYSFSSFHTSVGLIVLLYYFKSKHPHVLKDFFMIIMLNSSFVTILWYCFSSLKIQTSSVFITNFYLITTLQITISIFSLSKSTPGCRRCRSEELLRSTHTACLIKNLWPLCSVEQRTNLREIVRKAATLLNWEQCL